MEPVGGIVPRKATCRMENPDPLGDSAGTVCPRLHTGSGEGIFYVLFFLNYFAI